MIHFANKSCFLIGRNRKAPQPLIVASDKIGFGLKAEDVLAIVSYNLVFAINQQAADELKEIADKSLYLYELPDYFLRQILLPMTRIFAAKRRCFAKTAAR